MAVYNAAFYITCSLLMMAEVARGDHMEEEYSRAGLVIAFIDIHECPLLFTTSCYLRACTDML